MRRVFSVVRVLVVPMVFFGLIFSALCVLPSVPGDRIVHCAVHWLYAGGLAIALHVLTRCLGHWCRKLQGRNVIQATLTLSVFLWLMVMLPWVLLVVLGSAGVGYVAPTFCEGVVGGVALRAVQMLVAKLS